MKLFKHQYGGFVGEAPKASAYANMAAGSDTLGMDRGTAELQIEKLPNSMGGDTIPQYRVSQLLPRGGKRTISNGIGDYKSIIDRINRWKQQYGGGYSSVNVGGDVDVEDMNFEDEYTAPEEYQEGGLLAKAHELIPVPAKVRKLMPSQNRSYDYEVYDFLPSGNIYKDGDPYGFTENNHSISIESPKDEFGRERYITRQIQPRHQGTNYNQGIFDPEDFENDTTYHGWGYGEPSKETFNKTFNKVMQSALKGRVRFRRYTKD